MPSVVRFAALSPQPWANGRGETTEIRRVPSEGPLAWRLSVATITDDSPFSLLPGVARSLMTLADDGLELSVDGSSVHLATFGVATFDGAVPVHARGVVQASRDLNLMVDASSRAGELSAVDVDGRFSVTAAPGESIAVVVLAGRLSFDGVPSFDGGDPLGELDVVVLAGETVAFKGSGTVAVAAVRPLA